MSGFNSFKNINTWIFDLDNTLYHPRKKIFDMIHKRMTRFIANYFELNLKEARKIQTEYFYKYGTTLSGLMKKHNIKPNVFLNYVHDINFDKFEKDHKLNILLKKINGKKIIFTNADKKYALKVITKLGIRKNFRYIFDIKDANYVPKPDIYSYKKMVRYYKIDPKKTLFVEDIKRNLEPASKMGMATVWINNNLKINKLTKSNKFVDLEGKSLIDFLQKITLN